MTNPTYNELLEMLAHYQRLIQEAQITIEAANRYIRLLENEIRGRHQDEIETWEERKHLH